MKGHERLRRDAVMTIALAGLWVVTLLASDATGEHHDGFNWSLALGAATFGASVVLGIALRSFALGAYKQRLDQSSADLQRVVETIRNLETTAQRRADREHANWQQLQGQVSDIKQNMAVGRETMIEQQRRVEVLERRFDQPAR